MLILAGFSGGSVQANIGNNVGPQKRSACVVFAPLPQTGTPSTSFQVGSNSAPAPSEAEKAKMDDFITSTPVACPH